MIANQIAFLGNNRQKNYQSVTSLVGVSAETGNEDFISTISLTEEYELQLLQHVAPEKVNALIASKEASFLGVVLLIDANQSDYLSYLINTITALKAQIESSALAIGIIDQAPSFGQLDFINKRIRDFGFKAPVFEVSVESRADIARLLEALLISLDNKITV